MFDELVADATNGVGSVGAWARVEAAACARRLTAMVAILDARHAADGSAERERWYLDNWAAVSAEIGAAEQITSGAASHQLLIATALRDRLPQLAGVFAQGLVSFRVVSAIVWRTACITDPGAMRTVDGLLVADLRRWGPMSQNKIIAAIDYWVQEVDPNALRRSQTQARSRGLDVTIDGVSGLGTVWGTLFAHDAKALDARLDAVAATVCDGDPRTVDQRRADATGALAMGADRLKCLCGTAACASADAGPSSPVVVYVISHDDTLADATIAAVAQDADLDGVDLPDLSRLPNGSTLRNGRRRAEFAVTRPGVMFGGPVLPGPALRRAALTAAVRRVFHPGGAPPEPRYRPSARLAEFIRCRDLTCRFPGCDVPATNCDVDHTIPYPVGPTQASNLKCLCRKHHLLKTFWGGQGGWRDEQATDGSVGWISPTGQKFTTRPGSRRLFPALCEPTAALRPATPGKVYTAQAERNVGPTMPRRERTRDQERTRRIASERRQSCRPDGRSYEACVP